MTGLNKNQKLTYATSGVDTEAGEKAVALMKESILKTKRPEVLGDFGGFAGLFDASKLKNYKNPILATSTDGVGTKIDIAKRMNLHDTIGIDLVAMVVDDLVVCGAEPLFMTDYIAVGKVEPEKISAIVTGVAKGCQLAGCALLGGETAEHPGLMAEDDYDIAGAGTGVVDADKLLGPDRVLEGDIAIAIASSGLHSNGFSLARHVAFNLAGLNVDSYVAEFGKTLGEKFLTPTTIYAKFILDFINVSEVHSISHITGGGIAANVARVLPSHLALEIDRGSWKPNSVFNWLIRTGNINLFDAEKTFNMGIGMLLIVPSGQASEAIRFFSTLGLPAWECGIVRKRAENELGDSPAKGGSGGAVFLRNNHRI